MQSVISRRRFIYRTGTATAIAMTGLASFAKPRKLSPNEKLNVAVIGVANQGNYNLTNVASENIVALCDVDDNYLAAAARKFPAAKTYTDFRRLIDQKEIDAVVVATPDHSHAVAAIAALRSGRHVYCEKPLTRTISECRLVMEAARKGKLVTQIGTQIHAGTNYRRVVELVKSGVLGEVRKVHVWVSAVYGGKDRPADRPPIPANLHYDMWLGPVPEIPYHTAWVPFAWRNWWHFGGGALADFGCHFMDLPHWALDLRAPLSAEVVDGPPVHPHSTPPWLIVRYQYPARAAQPPVELMWYHGGKQPSQDVLPAAYAEKWKGGVLFVGSKGQLLADYGRNVLLPEKQFEGFVRPAPFIPDSIGHHKEWIQACKTGGPTTCSFDYSGALTEAVLLGNVAYRCGCKIDWDTKKLRARNCKQAEELVQHQYRKGWKI